MGIAMPGHLADLSSGMRAKIEESAARVLSSGAYLHNKKCGGLNCCGPLIDGKAALQDVVDAIIVNQGASSGQELFKRTVEALPLKHKLSAQDIQLCDLRGCQTVGDASNAFLQRVVARFLVEEAWSWLWPTARSEGGGVHPCCWALSCATCTCCCVRGCYENQVSCIWAGPVCFGPLCLNEWTHTGEAKHDMVVAIHAVPPLAVTTVSANWHRITAQYAPAGIDESIKAPLLTGDGARKADDKNWNWTDMQEYTGSPMYMIQSGYGARALPPAPLPSGFRVVAEGGVECTQKGTVKRVLKKGEEVYPLTVEGSIARLKGGLQCCVFSENGDRLLEPLTKHWQVCDTSYVMNHEVPTFAEKPESIYEYGKQPQKELEKEHLLKDGQIIVSTDGGIHGPWLKAENGRWAPICCRANGENGALTRILYPVPEPIKVAKDDPVLRVAPDRSFFNAEEFPELAGLAGNWQKFRDEALSMWEKQRAAFVEFEGHKGWMACAMKLWGHEVSGNLARAPVGAEALKTAGIPGLTTFCYSVLQPGCHIQPHEEAQGTSSVRAHLGLKVPVGCTIRVGPYARIWKEGSWIIFNGNRTHEVVQQGSEDRVVLLIDFGGPIVHPDQWPAWMGAVFRQNSGPLPPPPEPVAEAPPSQPGVIEHPTPTKIKDLS